MKPKYPEVQVQLSGEDGNAFFIIGRVTRAMRKGGAPEKDCKAFAKEAMSGNYDNVLRAAMKWVNVS